MFDNIDMFGLFVYFGGTLFGAAMVYVEWRACENEHLMSRLNITWTLPPT